MTDRIKLGLLTTWNTRCGIAEYSRYIVEQLQRRDDVDVTVFGSINHGDYKLREDEDFVVPTFEMALWANGSDRFLIENILERDIDVLHIQYQMLFYNPPLFEELLRRFNGRTVITYHDNDFPPGFPAEQIDFRYTHRLGVGMGECHEIAHGLENRKPVVKTFGRGRSRADIIGAICERNGWDFQAFFGGTGKAWLETPDLYRWLRDSDAIALWYDEAERAGSSGAVRIAISTRRFVVCNSTTWFNEIPDEGPNFVKADTPDEFERALPGAARQRLHRPRLLGAHRRAPRDRLPHAAWPQAPDRRRARARRRGLRGRADRRSVAARRLGPGLRRGRPGDARDPRLGRRFCAARTDRGARRPRQSLGRGHARHGRRNGPPGGGRDGALHAPYPRWVFASIPAYDDSALASLRALIEGAGALPSGA